MKRLLSIALLLLFYQSSYALLLPNLDPKDFEYDIKRINKHPDTYI